MNQKSSSHAAHGKTADFRSLGMGILTVSDTRTLETDSSGLFLQESSVNAGHNVLAREIVVDDIYIIRSLVSQWIAEPKISSILVTGGTGFTSRDVSFEAVIPLLDKKIDGFGEIFRRISYDEIGLPAIQSRAFAGLANNTVIFCLPGSTNACKTAWNIIETELNSGQGYCTLVKNLNLA